MCGQAVMAWDSAVEASEATIHGRDGTGKRDRLFPEGQRRRGDDAAFKPPRGLPMLLGFYNIPAHPRSQVLVRGHVPSCFLIAKVGGRCGGLTWAMRDVAQSPTLAEPMVARLREADSEKAASRLRVRAGPSRESPFQTYWKHAVCTDLPAHAAPMQYRCPFRAQRQCLPVMGWRLLG